MADCKCLAGCPFFNDKMKNMPEIAEMIKKKFCLGDSAKCARYLVFQKLGRGKVPADLFPRHFDRARDVIAAG